MRKRLQNITANVPAAVTLVLILLIWFGVSASGAVPGYMLPSPVDVGKALVSDRSIILMHANKHDLGFYKKLMEALKDRNYEYVTITELLNITSRYYYPAA